MTELTTETISKMSPDEAGKELARLTREHQDRHLPTHPVPAKDAKNAADARAALDHLERDPRWVASLMNGDVAARKDFDRLNALIVDAGETRLDPFAPDARARLPLIETVANGEMTHSEHIRHIEGLRELGYPDVLIREAMTGVDANTGKPFTPEMVERARQAKRIMESPGGYDPTDVTDRNRMMAVNIILANAGG